MTDSDKAEPEWHRDLQAHARNVREVSMRGDTCNLHAIEQTFGTLAGDVVAIVESFARGAGPTCNSTKNDDFERQLTLLLDSFSASRGVFGHLSGGRGVIRPNVIQSELWLILRSVRESAELFYARELDMVELDRRIMFQLHGAGPLVPASLSFSLGVDKAQVSRSVRRLLELQLITREQIRAPLLLTPEGQVFTERLSRLADLRNRELTINIDDADLKGFFDCVQLLLDRAIDLYEQERELAHNQAKGSKVVEPPIRPADRKLIKSLAMSQKKVVGPLTTLSAYFSRSGALAFRRLTGLSSFEAFVLSEIGIAAPVEWNRLVTALKRDHSQAGRTIKSLMERGLIEREGKPGRRHGRFYPSAEGAKLYEAIQQAGRERGAFLLKPLVADQRTQFLATVAKIRHNATAQLEREKAFAKIAAD